MSSTDLSLKSPFFWPRPMAFGLLVPQMGIEFMLPAVEAESQPLDTREVPEVFLKVGLL